MRYITKHRWFFIFLLLMVVSCAKMTEEKRAKLAQELYSEGMSAYTNRSYSKATQKLKEALKYIDQLTPQQIKDLKYALAESYYLDKDYINAVVYLEDYIFQYPDSPETEKAYYMLIDSYAKVAPDAYRDQTYTQKALEKARDFLSKYPNSPYADRVADIIESIKGREAKHQYLIARFYEDYGYYYSAARRYRDLLINYPNEFSEAELLYRYIKSLLLVRKQAQKMEEKYRGWINQAQKHLKEARTEEEKKAIQNRIDFLSKEIERWRNIAQESYQEGLAQAQKYKEVFGENNYYKDLQRYIKKG
ncbi:outer membrane protein assembly factor BamD [Thermocrinis minervae]|uniref:Beta-barrel assembly machine subunit BamD n=1 Tax=Thermocrinis minervae TaxID=381751 RepID=A0A1M6RAY7_9AQUI|nr:outer membrane protein assembly factor BamD [Thermocrinis minervae]SHK29518.1 Beta-barrel assembly machine subunit BamD [Thermocrinis minervae]